MITFVLGGSDTEMIEIEDILTGIGHTVVYAERNGARTSRRDAYSADSPRPRANQVWIECCHQDYSKKELKSLGIIIIDHHNPGDPGYGKPSSEYLQASSIGQLCKMLDIQASKRVTLIAAADHCLRLAYNNYCPGVTREELKTFRLAFYHDPNPEAQMEKLRGLIHDCPDVEINGRTVKDISKIPVKYNRWLTEVGCYYGLRTFSLRPAGQGYKAFLSNMRSKDIRYFMDEQCHEFGVVTNVYGDPKRQFAGCHFGEIYDYNT